VLGAAILVPFAHLMLGLPWPELGAYVLGSTASALSVIVVVPGTLRVA
jgi:hypothetical protein